MKGLRRKEKEIRDKEELTSIIERIKYITVAMCRNDEPYLVTLNHGYDRDRHCIYFHCAEEGKKIDFLKANNRVWGQALIDKGYVQGACKYLYATTQFLGKVTFVENLEEKKRALEVMIKALDDDPETLIMKHLTKKSLTGVQIGRINIEYMSGKRSEEVMVSI